MLTNAVKKPHVSVVMPAYNAERTIEAAVRSVLSQSLPDLELIVCDDASTDATLTRLNAIDDPRLIIVRNFHNSGVGATRDRAISCARGDWLAFIDSDDAWLPHRMKRLLSETKDHPVMLFDNIMQCHDSDSGLIPWRVLRATPPFRSPAALKDFVIQERLLIKPVFPRSIVTENHIRHSSLPFGEDSEFFLRVLATGIKMHYIQEPMYLYRYTPGSASNNPEKHRMLRHGIERVARDTAPSDPSQAALSMKIGMLLRAELYETFKHCLRRRELMAALRLLLTNSWMALHALRRVVRASTYKLHRAWHGARGRDSAP